MPTLGGEGEGEKGEGEGEEEEMKAVIQGFKGVIPYLMSLNEYRSKQYILIVFKIRYSTILILTSSYSRIVLCRGTVSPRRPCVRLPP